MQAPDGLRDLEDEREEIVLGEGEKYMRFLPTVGNIANSFDSG